jgi:hypothetical protein
MKPSVTVSPERMNFSQRLIDTLASSRSLSASPTSLAREFNFHFTGKPVTVHAARKWLVGEAIPTQDKLRALANWLGVSVEWLRFGNGGQSPQRAGTGARNDTSPQASLIRLYLSLPQKERELVRDFIEMLAAKHQRESPKRAQTQAEGVTLP